MVTMATPYNGGQNPADVHPILQSCRMVWYYDVLRYFIAVHPHIIRKFVRTMTKNNVFQFSMIFHESSLAFTGCSLFFPKKSPIQGIQGAQEPTAKAAQRVPLEAPRSSASTVSTTYAALAGEETPRGFGDSGWILGKKNWGKKLLSFFHRFWGG